MFDVIFDCDAWVNFELVYSCWLVKLLLFWDDFIVEVYVYSLGSRLGVAEGEVEVKDDDFVVGFGFDWVDCYV